jgi:hypothetical protein
MSEIKVNKLTPRVACGTVTLGDSGDAFTIPSGVTITNNGTQVGFGRTGTVDWVTTPKVTGDSPVTAASGSGYFLNTTAGEITINLPAGAAGSIVSMADYARTWQTNKVTVSPNGSEKIGGTAEDAYLTTEGQSVTFVYVDSTQGWLNTMDSTSNVIGVLPYVTASGGNQSPACGLVCGDYKTHIFTGPGTLCVTSGGSPVGSAVIDYLVVAGGGAGGTTAAGSGGGAGGFRMSNEYALPGPATSPIASPTGLAVSVTGYPIQIGGGGTPTTYPPTQDSVSGTPSIFSTITSAGGGGGVNSPNKVGVDGGSGSGGKGAPAHPGAGFVGGAGNTPPVVPSQGFPGGAGYDGVQYNTQGGGGGGAAVAGGDAGPGAGAPGGNGSFLADGFIGPTAPSYGTPGPTGSTRYFAGGGGGATDSPNANTYPGGDGGGGTAGNPAAPAPSRIGTVNTGGGGGGGATVATTGGSGIVMIRYKFQN